MIIATQAPVAADLRTIVAVLNIIVDLERMGDHAEGNAKIVQMMGDEPLVKPLVDLPNMARIANEMLRDSLNAFLDLDVDQARRVMERDDEVDQLQAQVYNELLTIMLADPRAIHGATYLLWTSHNIERIADRVTNICERVIFAKTGEMKEAGAIKAGRLRRDRRRSQPRRVQPFCRPVLTLGAWTFCASSAAASGESDSSGRRSTSVSSRWAEF